MLNLGLKSKLFFVVGIPTVFFMAFIVIFVVDKIKIYNRSELTEQIIDVNLVLSEVVHTLQKERGKSVSLIAGVIAKDELENQYKETDAKIQKFEPLIKSLQDQASIQSESLLNALASIKKTREHVLSKTAEKPEVIKFYSDTINLAAALQIQFSEHTNIAGVPLMMRGTSILEASKESAGKLRATMMDVLAVNKPLSAEKFTFIYKLKENIESELHSPGLVVSSEVKKSISDFSNSNEWNQVSAHINQVLTHYQEGNFGIEGKAFFAECTKSIDLLAQVIKIHLQEIKQVAERLHSESENAVIMMILLSLAVLLISVSASVYLARSIVFNVGGVESRLLTGSDSVGVAVTQLNRAAQDLTSATEKQSAALETTSSATDEILAMIKKSSDMAGEAEKASIESKSKAEKGNEIMSHLAQTMESISQTNDDIANYMQQSNQKVADILKVVEDVGNKTKVINDIVFQTKLLSFNASVEAARAGEHGKGFAVVAEEVGNLAQMSGNSAREINSLIDQSLSTVQSIVKETESKVKEIVKRAQDTVKTGVQVSEECGVVLNEIVESSQRTSSMVNEISVASEESLKGMDEIAKSIRQLESVTQTNSNLALNCARASDTLSEQGSFLRTASNDLSRVIWGQVRTKQFVWNKAFELGVPSMDLQHQELIQRMNLFSEALTEDRSNSFSLFKELATFVVSHFSEEEEYMKSIEYPEFIQHQKIHKALLEKVGSFSNDIENGRVNKVALMEFLNDWLRDHILKMDMRYAEHGMNSKRPRNVINFRKSA